MIDNGKCSETFHNTPNLFAKIDVSLFDHNHSVRLKAQVQRLATWSPHQRIVGQKEHQHEYTVITSVQFLRKNVVNYLLRSHKTINWCICFATDNISRAFSDSFHIHWTNCFIRKPTQFVEKPRYSCGQKAIASKLQHGRLKSKC